MGQRLSRSRGRAGAGLRIQLQLEVMRGDVHAAIEIEAVGGEALHAGIKSKMLAAVVPGVRDKPIEKRRAKATRTIGVMGDQVVDVESSP